MQQREGSLTLAASAVPIDLFFMTHSTRWFLLASLLCAALAAAVFLPGLSGDFVFDDKSNIVDNPAVHLISLDLASVSDVVFGVQPGGITRVLPTTSFALDYWRGGGVADPSVFKATNLAIHALTTAVLAWFFLALLTATGIGRSHAAPGALALAVAWAVHPLQVSSVLYVVQRMQTMSTLFTLLALLAYLHGRLAQLRGASGRPYFLLGTLAWICALGSKEDGILLPVYALCLELTVLQFRADDQRVAKALRKLYTFAAIAAVGLFLFVILPHYWTSENYYGRDFSSAQRLLTQARVLCMYLWQIVVPLPSHMSFYYDWVQPSAGFLQPASTLYSLVFLAALMTLACVLRNKRPLFAFGVLVFFSSHLITSNVVPLELAFEHRNHFGLIGAVVAVGDLIALAASQIRLGKTAGFAACAIPLIGLGTATYIRATSWNSRLNLAKTSTELAPESSRAWNSLCMTYFDLSKGEPGQMLDKAINACDAGSRHSSTSISSLVNLVAYKSRRGDATAEDWARLKRRVKTVNMGPENSQLIWVLIGNIRSGIPLDQEETLNTIGIAAGRMQLNAGEYAAIGYFVLGQTHFPERSMPYFSRSVELAPPGAPLSLEIIDELRQLGYEKWASDLQRIHDSGAP